MIKRNYERKFPNVSRKFILCVLILQKKGKNPSPFRETFLEASRVSSLQKIKIKIKTQRERIQIKTSLSKNKWKKNFSFFSGRIEEDEDRWKSLGSFASKLSQGSRGSSTPRLPGLDANRATLDCDTFLANARGGDATASWKHGRGSCPSCTFFDSIRYSYFSPVSNEENDGGRLVDQRHDPRLDPGR